MVDVRRVVHPVGKRTYEPDPRPLKRVKDSAVMKALHAKRGVCVIRDCGLPGTIHHIYPRGQGGDDVECNLVFLCGHGTAGHHGLIENNDKTTRIELGEYLLADRPDFMFYMMGKLGEEAARAWLRQKFFLSL